MISGYEVAPGLHCGERDLCATVNRVAEGLTSFEACPIAWGGGFSSFNEGSEVALVRHCGRSIVNVTVNLFDGGICSVH